jgi:hypothetical protein
MRGGPRGWFYRVGGRDRVLVGKLLGRQQFEKTKR